MGSSSVIENFKKTFPKEKMPRHVAIIMDGNGRWAKARMHPRVFGHVRGMKRVKEIVRVSGEVGIQALSLYAFSTENWKRPDSELQVLWKLLKKFLKKETSELYQENVRLRAFGQISRLDKDVRAILDAAIAKLQDRNGLNLNLLLSYGSRAEIADAVTKLIAERSADKSKASTDEVTEDEISKHLWTSPLGQLSDVDLVIRTSGEKRLSNFLLWQTAYSEFIFEDRAWPDFSTEVFLECLAEYFRRSRRYGDIK